VVGALAAMLFVVVPVLHTFAAFSWFVGALIGGGAYWGLMRRGGTHAARTERARIRLA
jgi:cytosine/uracil/thiamine/allantoin permease